MVQLPLALVGLVYVLAWANNCAIIKATWCGQVISFRFLAGSEFTW